MSDDKPKPPRPRPSPQPFPAITDQPRAAGQMTDETVRVLRDYLAYWQKDQEEGNTIGNLRNEIHDVRLEQGQMKIDLQELSTEQKLVRLRLDRHGRDIRDLKARVFHSDPEEHDTGVHQVEDLKRHLAAKEAELKERRDSVTWWKRRRWEWAMAAAGATAMAGLSGFAYLLWYIFTHGAH